MTTPWGLHFLYWKHKLMKKIIAFGPKLFDHNNLAKKKKKYKNSDAKEVWKILLKINGSVPL